MSGRAREGRRVRTPILVDMGTSYVAPFAGRCGADAAMSAQPRRVNRDS